MRALPECGEDKRAAECPGAEGRCDQAEHVRVRIERLPGEQREQHVEVERDGAEGEHAKNATDTLRDRRTNESVADAPAKSGLHLGRHVWP